MTNKAQQVVIVDAAVPSLHHERLVIVGLHGSQLGGMGHCFLIVIIRNATPVIADFRIAFIDSAQHGIVDRLQGNFLDSLDLQLQPFHGRLQRVGTHHGLYTSLHQTGFQQLAVGTLLLCFLRNLLQHLQLGLRQIALLCLFHLLPQVRVCLSKQKIHWHDARQNNSCYFFLHNRHCSLLLRIVCRDTAHALAKILFFSRYAYNKT